MRRGRGLLCALAAIAAFLPASADAATTVGSSLRQRANFYVRCAGTCTAAQSARPGGAGLTIPSDGVITRWRVRAASLGQVRLRILRPEADGGYTSVASSDPVRLDRPHQPGQDVLYEFPARITVHAGDAIGLDRDAKAGGLFHTYGTNTTYAVANFVPALKDDASDVQPTSNTAGRELLLNVDVEKDGDGDGFGDESQDNCPTIANDQTDKPCTTPPPSTSQPQGPDSQPQGPTSQPQGPTSTPIDTHTNGSAGPPVGGERARDRTKRRHAARHHARRSPPPSSDPQRLHGRRPSARHAPPKSSKPDSGTHTTRPRARKKPAQHRRPSAGHQPGRPRPKPPTANGPSERIHENTPAHRPTPKQKPHRVGAHRRPAHRPAPHPSPPPGWQHH